MPAPTKDPKHRATEPKSIKSPAALSGNFRLPPLFFLQSRNSLSGLKNYPGKNALPACKSSSPTLRPQIGIHQFSRR